MGRHVVHRGGRHAHRSGAARLDRQRPPAAARRVAAQQPQRVAADGAARHLPRRAATTAGSRSPAATTPTGARFARAVDEPWCAMTRFATLAGRLAARGRASTPSWRRGRASASASTRQRARCVAAGVPAAAVAPPRGAHRPRPQHRGLGPVADGRAHERWARSCRRAAGAPLGAPTGRSTRGAPCLGEHNDQVFGELLGLAAAEIAALARRGGHLMPGPLEGLRVVELAHERTRLRRQAARRPGRRRASWSSRPAAAPQRRYAPFLDDEPEPEAQPLLVALQHEQARRRARSRHAARPASSLAS